MQKIRVRLSSYDHRLIDKSAREIIEAAKGTGAKVRGPIPLPTDIVRITVLRSPHTDKRSREQFEMRTHKRIIDIIDADMKTTNMLSNLMMPAGVDIRIQNIQIPDKKK